jgi:DNA-binding FadR family transcriptional regulator
MAATAPDRDRRQATAAPASLAGDSGADAHATQPVLTQLQGWLANATLPPDGRLPPERDLAETLGVTRAELRKALAVLESDGALWRQVGRGTFMGARPIEAADALARLAARSSPAALLQARLALEPELARAAALAATEAQLAEMAGIMRRSRAAQSWREYESLDARLHRAIAEAANNPLLLHLFDTLAAVRRAVTWRRHRGPGAGPPPDHHSFADHDAILAALGMRDAAGAAAAMRAHITTVQANLSGPA